MKSKYALTFAGIALVYLSLSLNFAINCTRDTPTKDAMYLVLAEVDSHKKATGAFPSDLSMMPGSLKYNIERCEMKFDSKTNSLTIEKPLPEHYEYSTSYLLSFGVIGRRDVATEAGVDRP